jgi:hypothetical protein
VTKDELLTAFDELVEEAEHSITSEIAKCEYAPYKQILENTLETGRKNWALIRGTIEKNQND